MKFYDRIMTPVGSGNVIGRMADGLGVLRRMIEEREEW